MGFPLLGSVMYVTMIKTVERIVRSASLIVEELL